MARDWLEREGWDAALTERVRTMVDEIALRNDLEIDRTDVIHLDVARTFPQQAGLSFELWFSLSGDEVTFGGEGWFADIFPVDEPDKLETVRATLDGLISGEGRVLLYTALGRTKPYWSVVQLRVDGRWTNISTGLGCAMPPIARSTILRNGHQLQAGHLRPAWGSVALFVSAISAAAYIFS